MASFLRQGASVTASLLETSAGMLRRLADTDTDTADPTPERAPTPKSEPEATRSTQAAPKPVAKKRPAPATRTMITNPKAARKARQRRG
jgi:hypothetical protein